MRVIFTTFFIITIFFSVQPTMGQTIINAGIGPSWQKDFRDTKKPISWCATIKYGRIFDNIIGVYADIDFSWNIQDSSIQMADSTFNNDTVWYSKKISDNKTFMFPISAGLFLDPIPQFRLHPVIRASFGLNMAVRDIEQHDNATTSANPKDGFYIGIIGKGGAEAVFDIGDHASIFAGFEYRWGRLRHRKERHKQEYIYHNFNAPAIRIGLSILF